MTKGWPSVMIKRRPMPGVVTDPRSWGLLAVGLIYFSRGLAYTFTNALEPLPYGLETLSHFISIKVYGVFWLLAAGLMFWMGLWRTRKIWAVSSMTAMPTLWGLAYLLSWVVSTFQSNSWTGAFVYGCLAVIALSFGIIQPQKVVFFRAVDSRRRTD